MLARRRPRRRRPLLPDTLSQLLLLCMRVAVNPDTCAGLVVPLSPFPGMPLQWSGIPAPAHAGR